MKSTSAKLSLLALVCVIAAATAPRTAVAESVTGKKYSVYIYSRYVAEPATTITFKSDGVLLMSTYSGFGSYYAFANGVGAFFAAPEVEKNKDLFMLMVGLLLGDFLSGAGITFTNGAFSEVFFFSGYVSAG